MDASLRWIRAKGASPVSARRPSLRTSVRFWLAGAVGVLFALGVGVAGAEPPVFTFPDGDTAELGSAMTVEVNTEDGGGVNGSGILGQVAEENCV